MARKLGVESPEYLARIIECTELMLEWGRPDASDRAARREYPEALFDAVFGDPNPVITTAPDEESDLVTRRIKPTQKERVTHALQTAVEAFQAADGVHR